MRPLAVVTYGGERVELGRHLRSLRLVDEVGTESDVLTLSLVGGPDGARVTRTGDVLECHLGYEHDLQPFGRFTVDELRSAGGAAGFTLSVTARATDMLATLKAKRTESHTARTLGALVADIAARHDLQAEVSPGLASVEIWHPPRAAIAQTDESDLHFLRRLARRYDAACKPVAGRLVFVKAAEGKNARGAALPIIALSDREVTRWSARAPERPRYASARAVYVDPDTRETTEVVVGEGEPVLRVQQVQPDRESAEAAARAARAQGQREGGQLSITLPGRADLKAERLLSFASQDPLADGAWRIMRATHELRSGYTTTVECERPGPGADRSAARP